MSKPSSYYPHDYGNIEKPILVLLVSTPLKNMKVKWDDYSKLNGKIKAMFQTTNQLCL